MLPDITTIKYWAAWDYTKKPFYTLWVYSCYVPPPVDGFTFKEKKGKRIITIPIHRLMEHMAQGTFRPFVLVSPTPSTYKEYA